MRLNRRSGIFICGYCDCNISKEAGLLAMRAEPHGEDEQTISVKDITFFDKQHASGRAGG